MMIRFKLFGRRITFAIAKVTDVIGVNSNLPDGKHVIMWDFDNVWFYNVRDALIKVRDMFKLPEIYIFHMGKENSFTALCLKRCTWKDSIKVVAMTDYVCPSFFKYGVYRERWTIRISPKEGRVVKPCATILSLHGKGDVDPRELKSFVKYETLICQ